jgi:BirA family biotin operon repressor/biotin-[acetyl-CoA-carboxylase] ligase
MPLQQVFTAWSVDWLDHCGSTSDCLTEAVRHGARPGLVIATTDQRGGRGRRGACWLSPPGAGLALSVFWRSAHPVALMATLSLVVGVALVDAAESLGVRDLTLKWPNDLLHGGAKLAGVLVETVSGVDRTPGVPVVIGIGINLSHADILASALGRPVTDLIRAGVMVPEGDLAPVVLSAVLAALGRRLVAFERGEVAPMLEVWAAHDALAGREIRVLEGDRVVVGVACGLAADGALRVRTGTTVRELHSGEVSLGAIPIDGGSSGRSAGVEPVSPVEAGP